MLETYVNWEGHDLSGWRCKGTIELKWVQKYIWVEDDSIGVEKHINVEEGMI